MMNIVCVLWLLVTIALLLAAAWRDVASRLIPNATCLALALTGMAGRVFAGPAELAISVAVAAALFLLLLVPYSFGALGGGDVKLLAAAAFGMPPIGVACLLIVTVLAGGGLALIHLALRFLPRPRAPGADASTLRRIWVVERWRIIRHAPLPYGVAIACGGIWTMTQILGA
jgi:prepilin peptidase CpaA